MWNTLLLLSFALLILPCLFLFDGKIFNTKMIRSAIGPSAVVAVVFAEASIFFTGFGVIKFNPDFIVGFVFRGLPIHYYLFLFAFSFAGLGIYNYLNAKFPKNDLQKFSLAFSHLLLGICIAVLFFAYSKWYAVVTFSILFLLLIYVEYVNQLRFMYRFYRAFIVCLIPFYACYAILCLLPVMEFNAAETINVIVAKIPVEAPFFMMGSLLLGVYLSEFFENRKVK